MDKYRVNIEKLDHFGRGIAKLNGKVVFVPFTIDSEVVDIEITLDKKKYMEGKVLEIIKPSIDRVKPICPYFGICGGCDIMHMTYSKQLDFKYNKVLNIMSKYANIDCVNNITGSPDIFNYRNKVTFKSNGKIGLSKKKSNEIVNIDDCAIIDLHINRLIATLNTLKVDDNVMVRYGSTSMIVVDDKPINNAEITIDLGVRKYIVSPRSFFQVNTKQTIKLYDKIKELADLSKEDNVLDLYCGTGTIGLYLSEYCNKVLGIEIVEDAIFDANRNKELNNVDNIEFICGDCGTILKQNKFNADVIVIDPPRSGLDDNAIKELIKINAKKIVYVSCDPMTLARDLNILKDFYNVISINPFDMFPQTYHVENVALLQRKSIEK